MEILKMGAAPEPGGRTRGCPGLLQVLERLAVYENRRFWTAGIPPVCMRQTGGTVRAVKF